MNVFKVLQVLDSIGLSRCKDTFLKEQISGDILCLLTKDMMENDLHMQLEDCTTLLNLVAGEIDVSLLL